MADLLLECLIQIKGLADTPRRLRLLLRQAHERATDAAAGAEIDADPALGAIVELVRLEDWAATALARMLTEEGPALSPWETAELAAEQGNRDHDALIARFEARRRALADRLERCSTDQLRRVARVGGRNDFSVSDLVAVLLAHDTDQLGRLRDGTDRRWR